jgi:hypothetical protein
MSEEKKVKLQFPILLTNAGQIKECNELIFSRFKTKHLKLLPADFVGKAKDGYINPASLIPLIAGLAGITVQEAEEIDMSDLVVIMASIKDFFGSFLMGTGEK